MLDDILSAIKPREEKVELGGHTLTVRGLASAADVTAMQDNADLTYKLVVRCVFDAEGRPVFTDAHIPSLKGGAKAKLAPLIAAVCRVNGFDVEGDAKNSGAAPA